MDFEVVKNEFDENVIKHLKEIVPEFTSVFDEEDGLYPALGEFGRYLIENIDNEPIASKCFLFVNEAVERGSSKTEDAIVIQIFQQVYDQEESLQEKARAKLSEKALAVFDEFRAKYANR